MLEGVVAPLLNRFLGLYVKNFDPKQLNVGIWSGDVKLKGLELRKEALDQLKLPINVLEGHLGQLTLSIPWSNLKGKPVKVTIQDVFLLAAPKEESSYNQEEGDAREHALKMQKLESAEILKDRSSGDQTEEEHLKNQSFTESLITAIVDNLQVTIENIHIRYEDSISSPGHPFAAGLTLSELSAVSTDGDWRPTFIQSSSSTTHKLATLGNLGIYWETDTELLSGGKASEEGIQALSSKHDQILKNFKDLIVTSTDTKTDNRQFILKPVNGIGRLEMSKVEKADVPKMKSGFKFDEIGFVLDDDQYRDALMLIDLFHFTIKHQQFQKYKPRGKTPKEDPKAWVRAAGTAVLDEVHERHKKWSWAYMKGRRDTRKRFIELFKLKKKQDQMTTEQSEELENLEKQSSYEDMRFWRSLARKELKRDKAVVKRTQPEPPVSTGWLAWAWGGTKEETPATTEGQSEGAGLTEEQKKELYDAIDFDERKAIIESVDVPKDALLTQASAELREFSFTLRRDPHGNVSELLRVVTTGFHAEFLQRPEAYRASISVAKFNVHDGLTKGSSFPQIAKVQEVTDENPDSVQSEPEPFFEMSIEQNPLDGSADSVILMKSKSIELVYNPSFVFGVAQFFKPPAEHMDTIDALLERASQTVDQVGEQTRAGLEMAVEEQKTLIARFDLQAPIIIIPENINNSKSMCLILNAGNITFRSEPTRSSRKRQIETKSTKIDQNQDEKDLESSIYSAQDDSLQARQRLLPDSSAIATSSGPAATQLLLSAQHGLKLSLSDMGIYLGTMTRHSSTKARLVEKVALNMSMGSRQDATSSLMSVNLELGLLTLRVSLRDMLAVQSIVGSLTSQMSVEPDAKDSTTAISKPQPTAKVSEKGVIEHKRKPSESDRRKKDVPRRKSEFKEAQLISREELHAHIEGLRIILIGQAHDLPLLDMTVQRFDVDVKDWSSDLELNTMIETSMGLYNFSKSSWEPVIEPWTLGLRLKLETTPQCMFVDVNSEKTLELVISTVTMATLMNAAQFLSSDNDAIRKDRDSDAPYRICNYTGYDIVVWAGSNEPSESERTAIEDSVEQQWRFEARDVAREDLSPEGDSGIIGLKLKGTEFASLMNLYVKREGETIHTLRSTKDGSVLHLLVEVRLGEDSIKYIVLRSPLQVENCTQIPIELAVLDEASGNLINIVKVPPGGKRSPPTHAAYRHPILIRPDQGFGYDWAREKLGWQSLLKRPAVALTCYGEHGDTTPTFHFQAFAKFKKNDPNNGSHPRMDVRIFAPVELRNLLPYDFKYRMFDKNSKKDWTNFLRKGGSSPVHYVQLPHLLLMSVDLQDTPYKASEYAIINASRDDGYRRENQIVVKDSEGLNLRLKLHYLPIPDSGGAFRITVFSPYVVLNKTGLDLSIKSKAMLQQARAAAGQTASGEKSKDGTVKPYMLSYSSDDRSNRAILKIGDSAWSKPQSFEAIGSSTEVVFPSVTKSTEMHVGITVEEGEGKYKLTKVVTLAPRFVVNNTTGEDLEVREPQGSEALPVKNGELHPLHFLRASTEKQLCVRLAGEENEWSSPFNMSDLGRVHIKIARKGERQKLVSAEILIERATIFIHLSMESSRHWPYSMRNESDTEFMFWQRNQSAEEDEDYARHREWKPIRYRLPPRSIMPYAWDHPAARNKDLIISANGRERQIKIMEIGSLVPFKVPTSKGSQQTKIIELNVVADGPTQSVILSNYKPNRSLYKQKPSNASSASLSNNFEVKDLDSAVTFKAKLHLKGLGISLISAQLRELAYLTFRDVDFKYSDSKLYQTVGVIIKWIQIDNQLYGGIFPIILYPSVVPKAGKEMEAHPSIHVNITKVKDESFGVLYIKYATILIQQMTLEIDEDFIAALLEFARLPGSDQREQEEGKLCDDSIDIPQPQQTRSEQDIYFELLNIQPAQLDISFVRTERVNVEDKPTSRNPLFYFMNVLTMALGNINDAPVRLNALILENARISSAALTQNITNHYSQEFMSQIHNIIGSADFLGNPVGLFTNLSSGVADIFYEPYQGLVNDDPGELGIGIARGATSFVTKSIFGVSDSFSKFTGSIAKGLAAASMDKEFQARRQSSRIRNRPKHALYGVSAGANSFVSSLASGVGGLARQPIQGAEKGGVGGFFKGVGKGFVGLATKPAIGVFDLASNVSEGIRNTTTMDQEGLERVRLTRFIARDGIVRPYNAREALGQFWLKMLDNGRYAKEEYIAHLELPKENVVVIVTLDRMMLIKTKKLSREWDVPLNEIQKISKERTGIGLVLRGDISGPFIPVSEESDRSFLYGKIALVVGEYNKQSKATAR